MDIKRMQRMVHQLAKKKGWWEPGNSKTDVEAIMLVVTELAEAVEEIRNGKPAYYTSTVATPHMLMPSDSRGPTVFLQQGTTNTKPEGTLIELADAVIRIMDLCGKHKWDLETAIRLKHEYNKTRPHRHGGKKL